MPLWYVLFGTCIAFIDIPIKSYNQKLNLPNKVFQWCTVLSTTLISSLRPTACTIVYIAGALFDTFIPNSILYQASVSTQQFITSNTVYKHNCIQHIVEVKYNKCETNQSDHQILKSVYNYKWWYCYKWPVQVHKSSALEISLITYTVHESFFTWLVHIMSSVPAKDWTKQAPLGALICPSPFWGTGKLRLSL